jgi:hypothetical protein
MSSSAENSGFKMDRTHLVQFGSFQEAEKFNLASQMNVDDRLRAIEFLRKQWIDLNGLNSTMDRSFFEYR